MLDRKEPGDSALELEGLLVISPFPLKRLVCEKPEFIAELEELKFVEPEMGPGDDPVVPFGILVLLGVVPGPGSDPGVPLGPPPGVVPGPGRDPGVPLGPPPGVVPGLGIDPDAPLDPLLAVAPELVVPAAKKKYGAKLR